MPSPVAELIVLDTLGKLYAHGHGLSDIAAAAGASSVPVPRLIARMVPIALLSA